MYVLGHVGLSILVYIAIEILFDEFDEWKSNRNIAIISFSTMLPDLIDKTLGSFMFNSGRWFGHTLLLHAIIIILMLLIRFTLSLKLNYNNIILVFYLGMTLHLVGDVPGITINTVFWPLFGSFDQHGSTAFLYGFESIFVMTTELIGLLVIVFTGILKKWQQKEWLIVFGLILAYIGTYAFFVWLLVLN